MVSSVHSGVFVWTCITVQIIAAATVKYPVTKTSVKKKRRRWYPQNHFINFIRSWSRTKVVMMFFFVILHLLCSFCLITSVCLVTVLPHFWLVASFYPTLVLYIFYVIFRAQNDSEWNLNKVEEKRAWWMFHNCPLLIKS